MEYSIVAAVTLALIGLAHSVLGEVGLLMPLFRAEWKTPEIPRRALQIILRFAWHATTVAWFALASILVGFDPLWAVTIMSVLCGLVMFVALRGHLSWPMFMTVAASCLLAMDSVPNSALAALSISCAGVFVFLGMLHVYWALGGKGWIQSALPTKDSKPVFTPTKPMTMAVALSLFVAAAVLGWHQLQPAAITMWLCIVIGSILVVRAVGDFRTCGFMKPNHSTKFELLDDKLFTPLVVLLSFGCFAGALV